MLPWQRATESFQFLSFVTTHLDCGSETAQNLNPNWSRSWSWSWMGWTGQTAPHGGAGQAGGEKRITFQSEQKEWTRNRPATATRSQARPRCSPRKSQRHQASSTPGPGTEVDPSTHLTPVPPPPRPPLASRSHSQGNGPSFPTEELQQNSRSSRRSSDHVGPRAPGQHVRLWGERWRGPGHHKDRKGAGTQLLTLPLTSPQPVPRPNDNKKLSPSCAATSHPVP